jgi:hypothetical protein
MPQPKRSQSKATTVYQLKVTLRNSDPLIWRRLLVPSDIPLDKLHRVLQGSMEWDDSHMHQFVAGKSHYTDPHMTTFDEDVDEHKVRLADVAPRKGSKLQYDYDFGDNWEHEIKVEAVLPAEPGAHYPVCVAGEGAAPPEDCGGVWGYASLVEALNDPNNPEHEDALDWWGSPIDPAAFDLDSTNQRIDLYQRTRGWI